MHFEQLAWDISFIKSAALRSPKFRMPRKAKAVKYPLRLLRYWFPCHFINHEFALKKRALTVCEVGVGTGEMLQFMLAAKAAEDATVAWSRWDAVDIRFEEEQLAACGYDELIEMNLEDSSRALPRRYDVMVLLHVLEHLHSPELILPDLVAHVVPGGILVGGFPSHPHWSVRLRERRLGRKAQKFGHVTAFSPKRVRDLARQNGLRLEFLSGAFLMRSKGFFLENFAWWLRANLLFGALFPSWPGEIYWLMRKPENSECSCPTIGSSLPDAL